jgi:hypothetical protein
VVKGTFTVPKGSVTRSTRSCGESRAMRPAAASRIGCSRPVRKDSSSIASTRLRPSPVNAFVPNGAARRAELPDVSVPGISETLINRNARIVRVFPSILIVRSAAVTFETGVPSAVVTEKSTRVGSAPCISVTNAPIRRTNPRIIGPMIRPLH